MAAVAEKRGKKVSRAIFIRVNVIVSPQGPPRLRERSDECSLFTARAVKGGYWSGTRRKLSWLRAAGPAKIASEREARAERRSPRRQGRHRRGRWRAQRARQAAARPSYGEDHYGALLCLRPVLPAAQVYIYVGAPTSLKFAKGLAFVPWQRAAGGDRLRPALVSTPRTSSSSTSSGGRRGAARGAPRSGAVHQQVRDALSVRPRADLVKDLDLMDEDAPRQLNIHRAPMRPSSRRRPSASSATCSWRSSRRNSRR